MDMDDNHFVDDNLDGPWNNMEPDWDQPPMPFNRRNYRNDRYNNAYGNYRGGYGPGGGWGPPQGFGPGPGPNFGPRPPFSWGRGFGPGGPPPPPMRRMPPDNRAYRYLLRCGVPKDQLKSVPRKMFELIEPEYCGLCAHSFDSFTLSRVHYISKNHLKNQKKWIARYNEMGPNRYKQQNPMKSRELYCELCDVQITSKPHALSHYAGKLHRAIVEGRKQPRNPMLLQENMRGRVEQLVRREKKNLKPNEEAEVDVKEAAVITKNAQPDLYCEICKTSMTCTEQMTMHLNGKKHLAKEKRHILSMMTGHPAKTSQPKEGGEEDKPESECKGEELAASFADEDAEEDAEDAEKDAGEDADASADAAVEEGDNKDEDEDKNDDWANGSGAWE